MEVEDESGSCAQVIETGWDFVLGFFPDFGLSCNNAHQVVFYYYLELGMNPESSPGHHYAGVQRVYPVINVAVSLAMDKIE